MGHEAFPAVLLDLVRHRLQAQLVGRSAFDGGVLEAADAVELGFRQPVEQVLEVFFGFAREADDEGRADGQFRADLAPLLDPGQGLVLEGRALMALSTFGLACWKGMSRYGRSLPAAISGITSSTLGYG